MTTTFMELGTHASSGEFYADRDAYLQTLVAHAAVTHYEDDATGQDQIPFTDSVHTQEV